jgi:hypothetical protein
MVAKQGDMTLEEAFNLQGMIFDDVLKQALSRTKKGD